MRSLNFQLKQLCLRNSDGSYQTQANRLQILQQIAIQLHQLGFRHMNVHSLKPKHITALVENWRQQSIAVGSQKNRMAALRWWAEKIDKRNVVARTNDYYAIPDRVFVTDVSKAKDLSNTALEKITDPFIKISLELQENFGLRREEAIKFIPSYADRGNKICLKATWTKGGRPREIPVRNDEQQDILRRAHALAGRGSLIPSNRSYIQQLRIYERQTAAAGLSKMHGLRHSYAQIRYKELTGREAPCVAPRSTQNEQNRKSPFDDDEARRIISSEIGHARKQITSIYLGSP